MKAASGNNSIEHSVPNQQELIKDETTGEIVAASWESLIQWTVLVCEGLLISAATSD